MAIGRPFRLAGAEETETCLGCRLWVAHPHEEATAGCMTPF
jgi:hypothetical protein